MAAINFPDNPTDGEQYTAENGVTYTYNASIDAWTGTSSGGGGGGGDNYWSETDDGSDNIYVTDLTSNVGIGTNSPNAKLDVNGDIYAYPDGVFPWQSDDTSQNSGAFVFDDGRVHSYRLSDNTESPLSFSTVDADTGARSINLVLTNSGRLGIGKSVPASTLDVNGKITAIGFNINALNPLPE